MKILILTDYYQPGNSRVQEQYAHHLAKQDHDVTLLGGNREPEKVKNEPRPSGFRLVPFTYHPEDFFLLASWRFRSNIRRAWNRVYPSEPPDVVICNQPMSSWFLRDKLANVPIKFYFHHAPWGEEWAVHNPAHENSILRFLLRPLRWFQQTIRYRLEKKVLGMMDEIIVLSEYMREKLNNNHPKQSSGNILKIPGGVDDERFKPPQDRDKLREKLNLTNEATWLLSVRRLVPRMGLDRLIETVQYLPEFNDKPVCLLIVGNGRERRTLQEQAKRQAPDRVRFEGWVSEEMLPQYYRVADLFVLPTRSLEGFGLVTVEALASGLPVAATRVGGTTEILNDLDPELLLPEFDPEDWSKHIQHLLETRCRDKTFRAKCREYATDRYSWSRGAKLLHSRINNHIPFS